MKNRYYIETEARSDHDCDCEYCTIEYDEFPTAYEDVIRAWSMEDAVWEFVDANHLSRRTLSQPISVVDLGAPSGMKFFFRDGRISPDRADTDLITDGFVACRRKDADLTLAELFPYESNPASISELLDKTQKAGPIMFHHVNAESELAFFTAENGDRIVLWEGYYSPDLRYFLTKRRGTVLVETQSGEFAAIVAPMEAPERQIDEEFAVYAERAYA